MQSYFQRCAINFIFCLGILLSGAAIRAQTTAFTYQGKLNDGGAAANGSYDMQFRLFDNPNAGQGAQQGATITNSTVPVTNGIFTVALDFGSPVFAAGANLYLEISLRPAGSQGGYTSLAPRQQLTSAPYSVRAASAGVADNAANLAGVPANQYVQTNDARLTDARNPKPGSGNYVQNTTTQQTATNFNIDGSGAANVFNSATGYNIGGERVLSNVGFFNLYVGDHTGQTVAGGGNSFFGSYAGFNATNYNGANNTFVGSDAGYNNTNGSANTFLGSLAGFNNISGLNNVFVGIHAGQKITVGGNNTFVGTDADAASNNLNYATAIGAGAVAVSSNTIVLGRLNGSDKVRIYGLGAPGSTSLCRNASNEISTCTAGNLAEKSNDENGAAKIDALSRKIEEQQILIDGLKKLVCAQNPKAEICR